MRARFGLLAALFWAGACGPVAAGDELPDLGGREITVVTTNAYPPLQYVDPETGAAMGWEYDAMDEIARRLHLEVSYETAAWEALLPAVAQGDYDIGMSGVTITAARAAEVKFSTAYMDSATALLTRADETRFADAAGFAADPALRLGAEGETKAFYVGAYEILGGAEESPRLTRFAALAPALQALLAGDVDLVLAEAVAAEAALTTAEGRLKRLPQTLAPEAYGFAFPPDSDLVAPVDSALAAMRADGTLAALDRKWRSEAPPP